MYSFIIEPRLSITSINWFRCCCRSEFIYGKFVAHDEMAFSDPTENGLAFAQSYTKRTDFLVYNM